MVSEDEVQAARNTGLVLQVRELTVIVIRREDLCLGRRG